MRHWGWLGDAPDTQMALLLGILVVAEACAVSSVPIAVASVVGLSAILVGRQLQDTYLLVGIVWPAAVAFGVGVGVMIRRSAANDGRARRRARASWRTKPCAPSGSGSLATSTTWSPTR